ncbi:MAG TPA: biotin/lipoyl-binding protein [Tepidisphaeraceae bacterium]|jgi:multidrug resistance efflux pump|nr:biotin/lipoyl-binding protein [Tepidisphaeraceae bacterium]
MIRKYLLPLLALCGVIFAIFTVVDGQKQLPPAQPVAQPAKAPFEEKVAGAGIVETASENIAISTPVSGLVTDVKVKIGSDVKQGEELFRLDDRDLQGELAVRTAALESAKQKLAKLEAMPRAEDLPPAEAKVVEARASLADVRNQLKLWESVDDKRAVSQDDVDRKRFAVEVDEARLVQATTELASLKAGAWGPDLAIARGDVASAEAQKRETEIEIDRRIIRAPVAGRILQVKIHPGEFATTGVLEQPLVLMGNVDRLMVRVDIDENDAWRIDPSAQAMAFVRGNRDLKTDLKFERVEPYVVPKKSLTGESTERVDTRVLQVLYSFNRDALPVYVGQQMDVFIAAKPVSGVAVANAGKE